MYYLFLAIFGLCLGSFCNVLVARMPKALSIAYPPSHCPKCKSKLRFYHNIPLISYFALGGKCAFCKSKISLQYPIIEALGALFGIFAFYLSGELVPSLFLTLVFVFLLALSVIDFRFCAVPESLLVITYFCAIIATFKSLDELLSLNSALSISLIFIGAIFIIKSALSAWQNRKKGSEIVESMGEADVIIFGIIGALCGLKAGFYAIMLACCIQLVFHLALRGKRDEAPFIPALFTGLLGILILQKLGFLDV